MSKKPPKQMIEDARELFVKYRGRNMKAIEAEMKERGWTTFNIANLRGRTSKDGSRGWVYQYNFLDSLEAEDRDQALIYRQRRRFDTWLTASDEVHEWHWRHQQIIKAAVQRI